MSFRRCFSPGLFPRPPSYLTPQPLLSSLLTPMVSVTTALIQASLWNSRPSSSFLMDFSAYMWQCTSSSMVSNPLSLFWQICSSSYVLYLNRWCHHLPNSPGRNQKLPPSLFNQQGLFILCPNYPLSLLICYQVPPETRALSCLVGSLPFPLNCSSSPFSTLQW